MIDCEKCTEYRQAIGKLKQERNRARDLLNHALLHQPHYRNNLRRIKILEKAIAEDRVNFGIMAGLLKKANKRIAELETELFEPSL